MKRVLKKIKWKKVILWLVVLAVILGGGSYAFRKFVDSKFQKTSNEETITTASVETRDIQNVLSSSGTISPLNSYEITTLVEGEVIEADFEEGDTVEEGQVLYKIDTDNLDNQIDNAQTALDRAEKSLTKAEDSYQDATEDLTEAKKDYQDAKAEYGNPNIASSETGIVKTLYVEEGDTVQKGTQIAEIYDNSIMLLTIPFSASDADKSLIGKSAEVVIDATNETLQGTVTKVSNIDEALSGNRLVNQVTIEVKNPGGITIATTATASIGNIYSSAEGSFAVSTQAVITAESSGEIGELKIEEGSKIKEGDIIYTLTAKSIEDQLEQYSSKVENAEDAVANAKDSIETAKETIEDAKANMQDIIDTRTDYSITAPVSGKVISKNSLVGDTIKNTTTLCVIYDLSAVTFEMEVDELDVMSVKVGQEVNVTADAFEDTKISGVVTNVSLESTSNQGVTQYPVTVRIDKIGDLLPGMNVTGEIIIEEAQGVLAIPADALMRGDKVYIKDDTVTEADGDVPAGFRAVDVETGISDGDYVEIKSGLTGEEEVYVERISEAVMGMMGGSMGFGMQGGNRMQRPFSDSGNSGGRGDMPSGGGMPGGMQ